MKKVKIFSLVLAVFMGLTSKVEAISIMIGDSDSFGHASTVGLVSAQGDPADTDGDGSLEPGEFLPDMNKNGNVRFNSGDDYDNRSAAESTATKGAQWTDVTLSQNYSGSPGLADDVSFTFDFVTPTIGDSDYGVDHFINFVFGDYDVIPMSADVDGTTLNFITQAGNEDGLIKFAYATVSWASMLDGQVIIDIIAPNEPYVVFDYALLDTTNISQPVPEPATILLLGSVLIGFAAANRKRKKS